MTDEHEMDTPQVNAMAEGIEATRSRMSGTLAQLESRVSSGELKEKVTRELKSLEGEVKEAVREQLDEAREKIKGDLVEAKESLKSEVREAYHEARDAVREATIGRVENMARRASDTAMETRDTIFDTVRANPVPAALVGIGLAWMFINRVNGASSKRRSFRSALRPGVEPSYENMSRYDRLAIDRMDDEGAAASPYDGDHDADGALHRVGEKVSDLAHGVKGSAKGVARRVSDEAHRVSEGAHRMTERAGEMADRAIGTARDLAHQGADQAGALAGEAREVAAHVADGARRGARRMESTFNDTMDQNPLLLGAGALAIGGAIGYALPRTAREDELMGPVRDELVDKAQGAAQDAIEEVQHRAHKAVDDAQRALQGASK